MMGFILASLPWGIQVVLGGSFFLKRLVGQMSLTLLFFVPEITAPARAHVYSLPGLQSSDSYSHHPWTSCSNSDYKMHSASFFMGGRPLPHFARTNAALQHSNKIAFAIGQCSPPEATSLSPPWLPTYANTVHNRSYTSCTITSIALGARPATSSLFS